jgi:hypothetical protein
MSKRLSTAIKIGATVTLYVFASAGVAFLMIRVGKEYGDFVAFAVLSVWVGIAVSTLAFIMDPRP